MSASKADATITADTEKDATITATIYQLKGGVKNAVIKDVKATLKKADGTDAAIAPEVNDGVVTVAANKLSDGSKLEAGTYTLTVAPTDTDSKIPTFTRNIVITDSQAAATFKRVSESGKTIDSCFEFYLNGEKLTTTSAKFFYGNADVTSETGKTTPVTKAVIKYNVGSHVVEQTVNIGLTVTITK